MDIIEEPRLYDKKFHSNLHHHRNLNRPVVASWTIFYHRCDGRVGRPLLLLLRSRRNQNRPVPALNSCRHPGAPPGPFVVVVRCRHRLLILRPRRNHPRRPHHCREHCCMMTGIYKAKKKKMENEPHVYHPTDRAVCHHNRSHTYGRKYLPPARNCLPPLWGATTTSLSDSDSSSSSLEGRKYLPRNCLPRGVTTGSSSSSSDDDSDSSWAARLLLPGKERRILGCTVTEI